MLALRQDPKTGFLESPSPNLCSFDAIKKTRAIELAREMVERGEMPRQSIIVKALGINPETLRHHLRDDIIFKKAWEEVIDLMEETLVNTMVTNGQKPSGYMDRITWLRAYRPNRWNPDSRIQILGDNSEHKRIVTSVIDAIDAEIVTDSQVINESTSESTTLNNKELPFTDGTGQK